jgi:hypothetical protein
MKTFDDFVIIEPIIEKMIHMISLKNSITPLEAMEQFYHSQTYELLITPELYVWNLSDKAIYDLWHCEQKTGNPRDSVYVVGEIEHE